MTQKRQTSEEKARAKARRAELRMARQEAERREAAELATRRSAQLEEVRRAAGTLDERLRELRKRRRRRDDLADHLAGFYEEVDKLAKGRAMLEVTPLVLQEANQVIRDAKSIVEGDAFLDRIKEFVPAGNNPVYPDVVVALRGVRQALDRASSRLETLEEHIEERLGEARTLEVALYLTVESAEPPSLRTIKTRLTGDPDDLADSWFVKDESGLAGDYRLFDEDRLDDIESIGGYFLVEEGE